MGFVKKKGIVSVTGLLAITMIAGTVTINAQSQKKEKLSMKKYIAYLFIVLASLTSCVKLLDKLPLNDYDVTSESAYNDAASYLQQLSETRGVAVWKALDELITSHKKGS